jgi:hypothetical protein
MDIRLMGKTAKTYAFLPFIAIILFIAGNTTFGISYLFLFLILLNSVPFSLESNSKSLKLYYSMPAKISNLVKGRYLFSSAIAVFVWAIVSVVMIYAHLNGMVSVNEIIALIITGVAMTIVCAIQYPLFFKFGFQKGRIISMIIYLLPALAAMMLPSLLKDNAGVASLSGLPNVAFYLIALALIVISYLISYLISFKICENKEI